MSATVETSNQVTWNDSTF